MNKTFKSNGTLWPVMKKEVLRTLKRTKFNKTHAAEQLGISLRTLRNWLNREDFNISQEEGLQKGRK